MPTFKIAVSKKETKCDTIWSARVNGKKIYLATDGTHPNHVQERWEHYQLDVDKALSEGVNLDLTRDNYGFAFEFPRPPAQGGSPTTSMTGRMLLCFENKLRQDRHEPALTFPLRLEGRIYLPDAARLAFKAEALVE